MVDLYSSTTTTLSLPPSLAASYSPLLRDVAGALTHTTLPTLLKAMHHTGQRWMDDNTNDDDVPAHATPTITTRHHQRDNRDSTITTGCMDEWRAGHEDR
ncbi:hypothetical protein BDN70DRAFT_939824 [Pholiota conissans]|uniref:Uncharacterized protein n=1 Tax=Pholiota conissans TaxID=109636 RepID=A0A9P5YI51_9AGAR|nr:hypothetical protein BDN70DRAFT_939824 [Pholiota conissans]